MNFGQALHFVLKAVVIALLFSAFPVCSLPIGDTQGQEQKNSQKIMVDPGTSSQVSMTSHQQASGKEDVKTTSQNMISQHILNTRKHNKLKSCKSLQEVLLKYFNETGNSLDTSYNTFTLADIFYSGLLVSPLYKNYQHDREGMKRRGDQVCNRLLNDWLRPQNVSSGPCSWHYNCTYNSDTFPSFKVHADLDRRDAIWQQCYEVKMTGITYFQKEVCQEDPLGSAENWVPLHNQEIVVGFTEVDY